jgi:putative glutamine amidotransferase
MLRNIIIGSVLIWGMTFIFISCESKVPEKIKIAISKEKSEKSTTKYADWLLRHNNDIVYYNLYPLGIDSALKLLETCNGLLLTGGEDVFSGYYGKIDDSSRCGTFDRYRDSLEFALIENAIAHKMPVFGVCRGEQILNISQGGTLYIDIVTDFDTTVKHRNPDWSKSYHPVRLVKNTRLSDICKGNNQGDVASSHHQGIEKLGNGFIISAYSEDNFPEAIEWSDTTGRTFLMAVQWHPEAMDTLHPLSAPLAKKFLSEAAKYNLRK